MNKLMGGALAAAVTGSIIAGGMAYAASHGDPIAMRKHGMTVVGTSMGTLAGMAKGEMDFDAKAALAALKGMNYVSGSILEYFPEGSAEGGDTTASPKIWEDNAGFTDRMNKFHADTAEAITAAPASQEDLGPLVGKLGENCKGCHENFRIKKE